MTKLLVTTAAAALVAHAVAERAAGRTHIANPSSRRRIIRFTSTARRSTYTARVGLIPIRNNETGDVHGNFWVRVVLGGSRAGRAAAAGDVHLERRPGRELHDGALRRLRSAPTSQPGRSRASERASSWGCTTTTPRGSTSPISCSSIRSARASAVRPSRSTARSSTTHSATSRRQRSSCASICTRFDLLSAPIFVAGESYGTWRAAGAAEALEKKGMHVTGVILLSGGVAAGKVAPDAVRTAFFVPGRTATAFYHKKLAPELMRDEKATLDEVQRWAFAEYAPAWERRDSLERRRARSHHREARVLHGRRSVDDRSHELDDDVTAVHGGAAARPADDAGPLRHAHHAAGRRARRRRRCGSRRRTITESDHHRLPAPRAPVQHRPDIPGHRDRLLVESHRGTR